MKGCCKCAKVLGFLSFGGKKKLHFYNNNFHFYVTKLGDDFVTTGDDFVTTQQIPFSTFSEHEARR